MSSTTRLVAGTAQWGQRYGIANSKDVLSLDEVRAILDSAFEGGVHKLDTARAYGCSEELIGGVLDGDERWQIFTKLDPAVGATEVTNPLDQAEQSIQASLRALRRDRLDALLLHRASQRTAADGEVWRYLLSLKEQGSIGALGISAADPQEAWTALKTEDVDAIQVATNLFDRRLLDNGFFDEATILGKRIFVRSVFLQGASWLDKDRLPQPLGALQESFEALSSWATERGLTIGELSLRFVLSAVEAELLVGCESPGQMRQNLSIVADPYRFGEAELRELKELAGSWDASVLDPRNWMSQSP